MTLLKWLAGHDTGLSSKAIALTALGEMPKGFIDRRHPDYPRDGDDFGRCYRLLRDCPDAKAGLDRLGIDGGPVWAALVNRWSEIESAYLHDLAVYERGSRNTKDYRCYDLMRSIIDDAGAA